MAKILETGRAAGAPVAAVVLVVEDEQQTRNYFVELAAEIHPDLRIDQAETVEEAVEHIQARLKWNHQYAAVILDLKLPSGRGENPDVDTRIYDQIRRTMPATYIIQCTSYTGEEALKKNLQEQRRSMEPDRYFVIKKEGEYFEGVRELLRQALAGLTPGSATVEEALKRNLQEPRRRPTPPKQFGFLIFAWSSTKRQQLHHDLAEAVPEAAVHHAKDIDGFRRLLKETCDDGLAYEVVVIDVNGQGGGDTLDNLWLDAQRYMPHVLVVYVVPDPAGWRGRLPGSTHGLLVISRASSEAEREKFLRVVREHTYGGRIEKRLRQLFEHPGCGHGPARSETLELAALAKDIEEHWVYLSLPLQAKVKRYFEVDTTQGVRVILL